MNHFMDIDEQEWQTQEQKKQQLAKDLMLQMDERRKKHQEEAQRKLDEEAYIERKLQRDLQEMTLRNAEEQRKKDEKDENRRLAAA